jgi:hypothetical protein
MDLCTPYIFYKLQNEFKKIIGLQHKIINKQNEYVIYMVKEVGADRQFEVRYNYTDKEVFFLYL